MLLQTAIRNLGIADGRPHANADSPPPLLRFALRAYKRNDAGVQKIMDTGKVHAQYDDTDSVLAFLCQHFNVMSTSWACLLMTAQSAWTFAHRPRRARIPRQAQPCVNRHGKMIQHRRRNVIHLWPVNLLYYNEIYVRDAAHAGQSSTPILQKLDLVCMPTNSSRLCGLYSVWAPLFLPPENRRTCPPAVACRLPAA